MKTNLYLMGAMLVSLIAAPVFMVGAWGNHGWQKPQTGDEYRLEGPFTQGNLSVFLIHGKDKMKGYKDKLADGGLFSIAVERSLSGGATSLLSQASCYILTAGSGSSCGLETCGAGVFSFRPAKSRSMT